jgi:ketosteroid isomerase-like protein
MIEARESRPPADNAAMEVRTLNEQYIAAVRKCDASWFQRNMSDDVVIVQGNGQRVTKNEFLRQMKEQPRRFRKLTVRDVTVRVFGKAVQVDADAPWELESGEHGVSRYIDTYAWLDGRWQVISAQVTLLPQS